MRKSLLHNSNTFVVKVRSSLVTKEGQGLDLAAIQAWAAQISTLVKQGKRIVLVSSGAVAEGMKRLNWQKRPSRGARAASGGGCRSNGAYSNL